MSNYWQQRMEQNLLKAEDTSLDLEKSLLAVYEQTLKEIRNQLIVFVNDYGDNGKLDPVQLRKQLTSDELLDFKKTLDYYISILQKYESTNSQKYLNKLENLKQRAKLSRLELISFELEYQIVKLLASEENLLTSSYVDAFQDSYYNVLYLLQTTSGIGCSFTAVTKNLVLAVLEEKYLGKNYSDNLWKNKDLLVATLKVELQRGVAAGNSITQITEAISDKLKSNIRPTKTLVRTEMNNVCNQATLKAYISQNVNEYELLATLDNKTSEICRELDGNIYKCSEAVRGVNYPPFHPNCRTTTIPHIVDNINSERLAKGEKGYYKVGKITFKEWQKKYT